MLNNLRTIQTNENSKQIDEIQKKLSEINHKIAQQKLRQEENTYVQTNDKSLSAADWTLNYKKWEGWNDVDELNRKKEAVESQIEQLYEQRDALGHVHDHSKEREFFLLAEETKMKKCEEYKMLGNYLFEEGLFDRAISQYQTAIGYYEYIFPEDEATQDEVEKLKYNCHCNSALCFIRLKEYRKAIESCTIVIKAASKGFPKAYFRRGVAHRYLDEYEQALEDFERCKNAGGEDRAIDYEIYLTKKLLKGYETLQQKLAESGIQSIETANLTERGETLVDVDVSLMNRLSFLSKWQPIEPVLDNELQSILNVDSWVELL